jgi:hypothetical protein
MRLLRRRVGFRRRIKRLTVKPPPRGALGQPVRGLSCGRLELSCRVLSELGFQVFPGLSQSAAELDPDRRIIRLPRKHIQVKAGGSFPLMGLARPIGPISALHSP